MLPMKRAAAVPFVLSALALVAGCGKQESASAPGAGGPAASAAKAGECGDKPGSACEIACETEKLSESAAAAHAAAPAKIAAAAPGQRLVYTVHAAGVG